MLVVERDGGVGVLVRWAGMTGLRIYTQAGVGSGEELRVLVIRRRCVALGTAHTGLGSFGVNGREHEKHHHDTHYTTRMYNFLFYRI